MAQLLLDLTDTQLARTLKVYGAQLQLGRDATAAETVGAMKTALKDVVMAAETNLAIGTAATQVLPWE